MMMNNCLFYFRKSIFSKNQSILIPLVVLAKYWFILFQKSKINDNIIIILQQFPRPLRINPKPTNLRPKPLILQTTQLKPNPKLRTLRSPLLPQRRIQRRKPNHQRNPHRWTNSRKNILLQLSQTVLWNKFGKCGNIPQQNRRSLR